MKYNIYQSVSHTSVSLILYCYVYTTAVSSILFKKSGRRIDARMNIPHKVDILIIVHY